MCTCVHVRVHMPVLGCQPDVLVSQQTQQAWLSTEPRNYWEQRKWPRDTELSRFTFQRLGRFRHLSRHLWSSCLLSCLPPPHPPLPETALWVLGSEKPSHPFSSRWSCWAQWPESWRPHACPPLPRPQRLAAATSLAFRGSVCSLSWSLSWQNGLWLTLPVTPKVSCLFQVDMYGEFSLGQRRW